MFVAALLAVQISMAKNHVIVIHDVEKPTIGHTEVKVEEGDDDETIITLTPDKEVSTFVVSVKNVKGEVLMQESISAGMRGTYEISTPTLQQGCIFMITDGRDIVYYSHEI